MGTVPLNRNLVWELSHPGLLTSDNLPSSRDWVEFTGKGCEYFKIIFGNPGKGTVVKFFMDLPFVAATQARTTTIIRNFMMIQ